MDYSRKRLCPTLVADYCELLRITAERGAAAEKAEMQKAHGPEPKSESVQVRVVPTPTGGCLTREPVRIRINIGVF